MDASTSVYLTAGVYAALVGICSRTARRVLLPRVHLLTAAVFKPRNLSTTNKKMSFKLIQKLALVLLPPRNPKWKYQKRSVSLLKNLQHPQGGVMSADISAASEEDEEYDIPEEIENVIDILQNGLREKDTVVRWSAAKGLGRVTNRLPFALADEVVGAIVSIFNPRESDAAWHGACLAIAELARRGLLLPARLPDIVPHVIEALKFEQTRGSHTIGSHVRDAACYVCWALARAYDPQVLDQVLSQGSKAGLAVALVLAAIFDREVNCRRAAAAAFQEHVGRSGKSGLDSAPSSTFPFGLEIIEYVNFFTLSNRSECYIKIAAQVAQFEPYRRSMIDHIVNHKMDHVDIAIRELAAKSLANLVPIDKPYLLSTIVPRILPSCLHDSVVNLRHGALLAIAEIVGAVGQLPEARKPLQEELLHPRIQARIRDVPDATDRNRLYRGKGAEWIRIAVCRLIQAVSSAGIPLKAEDLPNPEQQLPVSTSLAKPPAALRAALPIKPKPPLTAFLSTLEEGMKNPQEAIQEAAVMAWREFGKVLVQAETEMFRTDLVARFCKTVNSAEAGPAAWRGYALSLGCLPNTFIPTAALSSVLDSLLACSKIQPDGSMKHPEARRNAARALKELLVSFGFRDQGIAPSYADPIFVAMFASLEDYTTDNRGDIGSWVREAAIATMETLVLSARSAGLLQPNRLAEAISKLVKQLAEKMDRIREAAGMTLQRLIENKLLRSFFFVFAKYPLSDIKD